LDSFPAIQIGKDQVMDPTKLAAEMGQPLTPPSGNPRFDVKPYRPDYFWDWQGLGLILGFLMLGGLALGFAASVIEQWLWLVLLFPICIGGALGLIGSYAIKIGEVRHPIISGVAGFLGGCSAMFAMHYFDYQGFLSELKNLTLEERAQLPPLQNAGFWDYMDLMAQEGVTITSTHNVNGQGGINLAEIGIAAATAFIIMRKKASQPFCSLCNTWKQTRFLAKPDIARVTLLQAIKSGNVGLLAVQEPSPTAGSLKVHLSTCKQCGTATSVEVKIEEISKNSKGQESVQEVAHVSYPGEALRVLESLFTHDNARCPGCGVPPPRGQIWVCDKCRSKYDSFDHQAVCPGCAKVHETTMCPNCHNSYPMARWLSSAATENQTKDTGRA
jgi:hypothetical protein